MGVLNSELFLNRSGFRQSIKKVAFTISRVPFTCKMKLGRAWGLIFNPTPYTDKKKIICAPLGRLRSAWRMSTFSQQFSGRVRSRIEFAVIKTTKYIIMHYILERVTSIIFTNLKELKLKQIQSETLRWSSVFKFLL